MSAAASTNIDELSSQSSKQGGQAATTRAESSASSANALDVSFAQTDQYLYGLVQTMVDNVCLHDARV